MQFCSEQGCRRLVMYGRCAEHASIRARPGNYLTAHRWYTSTRWLRLRAEVIQDQPLCRACLKQGYKTPTEQVDHIVKHDGDAQRFWDRTNLQGLCTACHTRKTRHGE